MKSSISAVQQSTSSTNSTFQVKRFVYLFIVTDANIAGNILVVSRQDR